MCIKVSSKQWLLKCKFSASTRQKFAFLPSTRTRQNGCFQKYVRLANICQTVTRLAKGEFGKFGKFCEYGKFSKCRLDRFIHIKYVFCA